VLHTLNLRLAAEEIGYIARHAHDRFLIVDDIPETRDHLTKLLGFETDIEVVGAAASGSDALALATNLNPDVVLMDINMPDMDGIAATEKLSAAVPTASVVMMSVQGEADYLRRSMLAGAREFLVKPFSSDELTASIRQVYTREQEKLSRMAAAPSMNGASAGGGAGAALRSRVSWRGSSRSVFAARVRWPQPRR
jgi:pilus assembly protein CpaE